MAALSLIIPGLVADSSAGYAAESKIQSVPGPIAANHTSVRSFPTLSASQISNVKGMVLLNIGQSHGEQIPHGLQTLMSQNGTYGVTVYDEAITEGSNGTLQVGRGLLQAGGWDNYIEPTEFWGTPEGLNSVRRTLDYYAAQGITVDAILHTWCWHFQSMSAADVNAYFAAMERLESEYPAITFIYMTDTDDSTGAVGYNRYLRNQQVRNYCQTNGKVLFDFGELETWSASGLVRNTTTYGGVTFPLWHVDWAGDEYAHIKDAACTMKAKAMWWLLAQISGVAPPPPPTLISPVNAYRQPARGSLLFDWENLSGATGYGIELLNAVPEVENNRDPSSHRIGAALTTGGSSSFSGDTADLAPGTYYWRVIGVRNGALYGVFSNSRSFTVPGYVKPVLTSPATAFQALLGPLNFSWNPVPGATNYAIELCSANPGDTNNALPSNRRVGAAIIPASGGTTYHGDTTGLTFGQTYWWRIIAVRNGRLYGNFSAPRSFTLNSLRPTLNSPNDGITAYWGPLNFNWNFSGGAFGAADGYAIELLSDPPAANERNSRTPSQYRVGAAIVSTNGTLASYTGNTTGMTGVYWWRMIAIKEGRLFGEFSDARSFTTFNSGLPPTSFFWPAGNSSLITSEYGYRLHPIYGDIRYHYGLDIGVDEGTALRAPAGGTVTREYWADSVGYVIEIDHGGGIVTKFLHLSNNWTVPVGSLVSRGQTIGLTGGTGYLSTGAHLHFEVRDFVHSDNAMVPPYLTYNRDYTVNPLSYLP